MRLQRIRRSTALLSAIAVGLATALTTSDLGWAAEETLLSQGKPASASSIEDSALTPDLAVDGDPSTRWASAEGSDPQWIQVDLGAAADVTRLRLNWEAAYAASYRVEFSPDGTVWTTAYTASGGTGGVEDITSAAGTARYVRVVGTERGTAYGYSLWEFEVYGQSRAPSDYQAEDARIGSGRVDSDHSGYTGTGFVNYDNTIGSYVEWTVTVGESRDHDLRFRYANGKTDRPMRIAVDGTVVDSALPFPGTGSWSTWRASSVTVNLDPGTHTVRATATTSDGGPNVDRLSLSAGSPPQESFTAVAAGDIAEQCTASSSSCVHPKTADRARAIDPDFVITMGDNQYDDARLEDFQNYYDTTWGRFNPVVKPTPGNHESYDPAGFEVGYKEYFGSTATPEGETWYSYDVGNWHFIALDSNIFDDPDQIAWLEADLAANSQSCVAAYWHHPLYSSGGHGNDPVSRPVWDRLLDYDADLVLNGHDHHYERFAPQNAHGDHDPDGIVQIVGGMGGAHPYDIENPQPNSEFRISGSFGVVKLDFTPDGYSWDYVDHTGDVIDSSPEYTCH
ncbi:discoidin domain-containing protein [Salininema proteolyticum]|uniref:Discoidin domain-containing protein n=1 Tax=Salininema proteolyticum TaxID=1607685 RepID=A0ABV8U6H7_9ACTN